MHVLLLAGGTEEGGKGGVGVLRQSCELLLSRVMAARVGVEEVEGLLEQARVERDKLTAGTGEEEKSSITTGQLDDVTQQLQQRDKEARAQLQGAEADYKLALAKLVTAESNARKLWLGNGDTASLTRHEQSLQWSHIRLSMAADTALTTQLATIQDNTTAIAAAFAAKLGGGSGEGVLGDVQQLLSEWADSCRLNVSLQWERDKLWSKWVEAGYRSECEVEREREEAAVQFKLYREEWEEEKRRAEERNERLLAEAVKDALRLAEENAVLRQQLIEARSRI